MYRFASIIMDISENENLYQLISPAFSMKYT